MTATVGEVLSERPGLQRVRLADDAGRAYVLTDLVGPVAAGDEVVVNTTAVELGLGTGGWHVVHWNLSRREWAHAGGGHIMKLRYTSLQADVGAAEEVEGYGPGDLTGVPVVACSLHSQMAVVAAVIRDRAPDARIGYVMTDGAALPLALSDLVHDLRTAGVLDVTVTAGHAFGGDLEAVSLPSALEVATGPGRADVVVVAMGPGVVGTGTAHGTTAVEVAAIVDAAAALGAVPVVAVRASTGDARERHRGMSHHTRTALALVRSRAVVAVVEGADDVGDDRHDTRLVAVDAADVRTALDRFALRVTTMGRNVDEDPVFFTSAAAAGAVAADMLGSRATPPLR